MYLNRMVTEHDELELKIDKLIKYLNSDKREGTTTEEIDLLMEQCRAMVKYKKILWKRILLTRKKNAEKNALIERMKEQK